MEPLFAKSAASGLPFPIRRGLSRTLVRSAPLARPGTFTSRLTLSGKAAQRRERRKMSRSKWRLPLTRNRGNRYFLLFLFPGRSGSDCSDRTFRALRGLR
jgi:hypothetical protein